MDELNQNDNQNSSADGGTQDGGAAPHWFDQLPEEMRANESFHGWKEKTPADLLKSHSELEAKSKELISKPGDGATPEEIAAFEKRVREFMGVPEKVEDYGLQLPDTIPADDPVVGAFLKSALTHGLNKPQAQNVLGDVVQSIQEFNEAQKLVNLEETKKLWGADFDSNVALAVKGMEGAAADAGLSAEEVGKLSKNIALYPGMARIFAQIGKYYSEDKFTRSEGSGTPEIKRTQSGHAMLNYEKSGMKE